MNKIIQGDCLEELKKLKDNSVDLVCTDPPYGYSFMGKNWDRAVPTAWLWAECLRVLKPGAFCMVMSAPRSDVQMHMIQNLTEAGFRLDFTPIYWTYASGFPKAGNIGKLVDKRLGAEREVVGTRKQHDIRNNSYGTKKTEFEEQIKGEAVTPEAQELDGSYAGFQPKPAVEVIIVAMKPLSEKTFVDQALKNKKGITWLDDCRIPTNVSLERPSKGFQDNSWREAEGRTDIATKLRHSGKDGARFPANLLVSDDVLNDGVERKANSTGPNNQSTNKVHSNWTGDRIAFDYADSGSYSRYFNLDKWHLNNGGQNDSSRNIRTNRGDARGRTGERLGERLPKPVEKTLPFLIVPKASKSEKNKGLGHLRRQSATKDGKEKRLTVGGSKETALPRANHHPTVKPLKLMSYLITLGSRKGDVVLDPFVGSGTTCIAAKYLDRNYIGIEKEAEYVEIANARLKEVTEIQQSLL